MLAEEGDDSQGAKSWGIDEPLVISEGSTMPFPDKWKVEERVAVGSFDQELDNKDIDLGGGGRRRRGLTLTLTLIK